MTIQKEAEEIPKPAEGRVGVEPSTIATTPLVICVRRKWWYLVVSQNLLKKSLLRTGSLLSVADVKDTCQRVLQQGNRSCIIWIWIFTIKKKKALFLLFLCIFLICPCLIFGFEHFPFLGYSVRPVQVGTKHHEAKGHYENKWVQDKAAWTETKTVGWKCSCGAKK